MKRNLFGPSAWRWNSKYYGKPFGTYPSAPAGGTSVYTRGIGKSSTAMALSGLVLMAMQRLYVIRRDSIGCIAKEKNGQVFVEFPLFQEEYFKMLFEERKKPEEIPLAPIVQVVYDPNSGRVRSRMVSDGKAEDIGIRTAEIMIFMAAIISAVASDPTGEAKSAFETWMNNTDDQSSAGTLSNNLYSRSTFFEACEAAYPGSGIKADVGSISPLDDHAVESILNRADGIEGDKTKAAIGSDSQKEIPEPEADTVISLKGKYALTKKVLTEEEQQLVPIIPDSYQITSQHEKICRLIRNSSSLPNPVRNFLFVGEAGSGKTEAVKIEAFLANKPLLHQSMDPDTDKFDTCQQVIPDGNGGFMYVEGPLIEALEKGWFCEVSEADLILKQGALGYLNPLLDKTGMLRLSTGRLVVRHPEAVLFFTVNGSYEGCRPMNKAVKDRCMTIGFSRPEDDLLILRVMAESGLNDKKTVKKMVNVMHKVEDHCVTNCLDDGVVGVRSLIRWATAVACGEDPWEVAKESLLFSWTFDKSEHPELLKCVETQFTPKEVTL